MPLSYPLGAAGVTTRVIEAGEGDRPVVFLHGVGARADRWQRTLPAFAKAGFHCYAIDFPGHGFATKGHGPDYGTPGFAHFVAGVLDALGLEHPALVGTSLGGHVAAYLTQSHPHRVSALVLVGAVGLVPIGPDAGAAIRRSVQATDRASIRAKLELVLEDHTAIDESWVTEEWRINNSPGAAQAFEHLGDYFAEQIDHDVVGASLAKLTDRIPSLLVWGAQDRIVPLDVGRAAQQLLGAAPLVTIEAAGHAPYFEQPASFNQTVMAFLNRLV